jgi:hypothetical protein
LETTRKKSNLQEFYILYLPNTNLSRRNPKRSQQKLHKTRTHPSQLIHRPLQLKDSQFKINSKTLQMRHNLIWEDLVRNHNSPKRNSLLNKCLTN